MRHGKHSSGEDHCQEFDWLTEFDCSEREQVDGWSQLSAAERSAIERFDAEVWGLLPCAVDPVAPSSQCKERLMSRLESLEALQSEGASVPRLPRAEPVVIAGPTAPRWLLPLAAGLTLLAVGFAMAMAATVRDQREQLAALRAEVVQMRLAPAASAALAADLAAARENLGLVSSRGVEICALRPTETERETGEQPYGLLFLAADHQHWYVKVGGLEPAAGSYYQLWFETDGGLVAAGNLVGDELELSSPTMPVGTRAVHVSVERDPAPKEPSDEIVLFGNDMIQVL